MHDAYDLCRGGFPLPWKDKPVTSNGCKRATSGCRTDRRI